MVTFLRVYFFIMVQLSIDIILIIVDPFLLMIGIFIALLIVLDKNCPRPQLLVVKDSVILFLHFPIPEIDRALIWIQMLLLQDLLRFHNLQIKLERLWLLYQFTLSIL